MERCADESRHCQLQHGLDHETDWGWTASKFTRPLDSRPSIFLVVGSLDTYGSGMKGDDPFGDRRWHDFDDTSGTSDFRDYSGIHDTFATKELRDRLSEASGSTQYVQVKTPIPGVVRLLAFLGAVATIAFGYWLYIEITFTPGEISEEVRVLEMEAISANADWDALEGQLEPRQRQALYDSTERRLDGLLTRTARFADQVSNVEMPSDVSDEAHQRLSNAVDGMRNQAEQMLEGLREPDPNDKSRRQEALAAFRKASDAVVSAAADIGLMEFQASSSG